MCAHGIPHPVEKFLTIFMLGSSGCVGRREVPVGLHSHAAPLGNQVVRGGKFVNGLKDGVRAWDIAVCQIEIQCAFVHTRGNLWQLQERLDLRGKRDPVPRDPVVERLDPKTIPGNEEALAPAIPQGKRKHPLEQIQASFRALLIGMEDDLSIRPGSEGMASLLESAA